MKSKIALALIGPVSTIILFCLIFYVLRSLFGDSMSLLFTGNISGVASLTAYIVIKLIKLRGKKFDFERVQLESTTIAMLALLFTVFTVSGMATVDRSLTVYLLASASNAPIPSTQEANKAIFNGWVSTSKQMEIRIEEQLELGNLEEKSGYLCITKRGNTLVDFYRLAGKAFSLNRKIFEGHSTLNSSYPRTCDLINRKKTDYK